MRVLHPRHIISAFMDGVGGGKSGFDIADAAFDLGHEIAFWVEHGVVGRLVVHDRRAVAHRQFRVEHRRQDFVIDLQPAATFFRGALAVGDNGGDALADEAHDTIQH